MSPSRIFVTGATGFIGTKLVNALVARGHTVHAFSRASSNREGLTLEGVRLVLGDVMDPPSLRRGMEGCRYVFHLAAYAKNWAKDPTIFFEQNIRGIRNVFATAKEVDAERVVFTSTVVTFGPTPPGIVGDEQMPRLTHRYFCEYEESKVLAEREAMRLAAEGFPVVIVNPTRAYGPGRLTEGNSLSLLIDRYDRGKVPVLLNGGKNVGNYVLVDDIVEGHILAIERGRIGERYILGGENASLKEFFRLVDQVSGKTHLQCWLPSALGMAFGHFERLKAELLGIHPQITPGWVETFLQEWAYTSAKAERELGYRPTPLKEGIRRTYDWILAQRKPKGMRA